MSWAGAIIGMPFSLEGFAFFAEAIFLGVYLYGWDRISPRAHLTAGVLVTVPEPLSGMFVVFANAWMNTPAGFILQNGQPADVRPMEAMFNPSAWPQSIHMLLAAYAATGFVVAGIHAYALLRRSAQSIPPARAATCAAGRRDWCGAAAPERRFLGEVSGSAPARETRRY